MPGKLKQPKKASTVHLRRDELLTALQRVSRIVPKHFIKPILQGVRLEATEGELRLGATDLEVSLTTVIGAEAAHWM